MQEKAADGRPDGMTAHEESRIGVRAVLRDAWRQYLRESRRLLPAALVLALGTSLFGFALDYLFGGFFGAVGTVLVGGLMLFLVPIWLQALDLQESADARAGEAEDTFGEALAQLRPRLLAVTGAAVLLYVAMFVGMLLLVVPAFVIGTRYSQIVPAMVCERLGIRAAFRRSRELTRGRGRTIWGVYAVAVLIAGPFYVVPAVAFGILLSPDYADFLRALVAETIAAPFMALVLTSVYMRLANVPHVEAEAASGPVSAFSGERRVPAVAGRLLALAGAILLPIGLSRPFGESAGDAYALYKATDLLATEIAVAVAALILVSFVSRTRVPLFALAIFGSFELGQWLFDKPFLSQYGLGGFLLLGGSIAITAGALIALLARPAAERRTLQLG
jgi:hypothetical protein